MKAQLFTPLAVGCVMLSCGAFAGEVVDVADIKITFANPPVAPTTRLPSEVLYPHSVDVTGGAAFRNGYGAFSNIVTGRIAALNVTWADPMRFKTETETRDLLREVLSSSTTRTWGAHIWSWGDVEPSMVATVDHAVGKQGKWLLWCRPTIYWAYQDGNGKWWWGSWTVSDEADLIVRAERLTADEGIKHIFYNIRVIYVFKNTSGATVSGAPSGSRSTRPSVARSPSWLSLNVSRDQAFRYI
jgi:hypothetical protein